MGTLSRLAGIFQSTAWGPLCRCTRWSIGAWKEGPGEILRMQCSLQAICSGLQKQKHNLNVAYFDITYTAGRRKKTDYGHVAKRAKEILLYNVKEGVTVV